MRFCFIPLLWTLALGACSSDNEIRLQMRKIQTSQSTYDAGILSVGDRKTFPITLQSVGDGLVSPLFHARGAFGSIVSEAQFRYGLGLLKGWCSQGTGAVAIVLGGVVLPPFSRGHQRLRG